MEVLKIGSKGEAVKQLQLALGFGQSSADGIFGKGTENAVKEYQKAHNLKADGIVGEKTLALIQQSVKENKTPTSPVICRVIEHVKANGGKVFTTPYFINLFGVRNASDVNTFNDTLFVYWYDEKGSINIYQPKHGFTTDPGYKSLLSPMNAKGCAILKEGWYDNLWSRGKHHGKYSALVQTGKCTVYRDNDKDKVLDMDPAKVDTGLFGINMHRANENATSTKVENWSAGCQVWANPGDFSYFMQLINKAANAGQTKFSYFLTDVTKFKL